MMTNIRIFFFGGLTSYRALFYWLRPTIFVPLFLVAPLLQIALFVYVGRAAHLASASFFIIGNSLEYAATPCLFAMSATISGERGTRTLPLIIASPAARLPLFLGRSLPIIANGFMVSAFSLAASTLLFGINISGVAVPGIALTVLVISISCTGLGLVNASLGLRFRETAVLSNVILGVLLLFCGVNIPLSRLPGWMAATARYLPLTHGIVAVRELAAGGSFGSIAGMLSIELLVGGVYLVAGMGLLTIFEAESRRRSTLDRA
jgi:ABC-2 type transport system permease protein